MFTFNVDLGQVIMMGVIAVVGYLVKKEVDTINKRLDKHDDMIVGAIKSISRLFGLNGREEEE